jgi:hypothetical protein
VKQKLTNFSIAVAAFCVLAVLTTHFAPAQIAGNANPYFTTLNVSGASTLTGAVAMGSTASFTGAITPTGGLAQASATVPFTQYASPIAPFVALQAASADFGTSLESETELFVPANATLTGVCMVSEGTTDSWVGILRSAAGAALANTSTSGTALATANAWNCVPFTASVAVTGPQTYYVGVQGSATTSAQFILYATGALPKNYGCGQVSATYGTVAASVTVPTTFTTAKCPPVAVY